MPHVTAALKGRLRAAVRAESGLTLVEVIVAAGILTIVMTAVLATTLLTSRVTDNVVRRDVASALANEKLEEARLEATRSFSDFVTNEVTGTEVYEVEIDGNTYEVTESLYWSTRDDDPTPCAPPAPGPSDTNVIRIDVRVRWLGDIETVVNAETSLNPPVGLFDPTSGSIAVFVQDGLGADVPIPSALVTIDGPSVLTSGLTDATGCIVFTNLSSGSYEVTASKTSPPHRDQLNRPIAAATTSVTPGGRTNVEMFYAEAETLTYDVEGEDGGVLPTQDMDLHIRNGAYAEPLPAGAEWDFAGTGLPQTVLAYPSVYGAYAGWCDDSDPVGTDGSGDRFYDPASREPPIAMGDTGTLLIATLSVDFPVTAVGPMNITAEHVGPQSSCADTPTLSFGSVVAPLSKKIALPYGTWRITASGTVQDFEATTPTLLPGSGTNTVELAEVTTSCTAPTVVATQSYTPHNSTGTYDFATPAVQTGDLVIVTRVARQAHETILNSAGELTAAQDDAHNPAGNNRPVWSGWGIAAHDGVLNLSIQRGAGGNQLRGGAMQVTIVRDVASATRVANANASLVGTPVVVTLPNSPQALPPTTPVLAYYAVGVGNNSTVMTLAPPTATFTGSANAAGPSTYLGRWTETLTAATLPSYAVSTSTPTVSHAGHVFAWPGICT